MKDYIYNVMTQFALLVSLALGNRITGAIQTVFYWSDVVEQTRLDIVNAMTPHMTGAPAFFNDVILWLWSTFTNFTISPVLDALRMSLIRIAQYGSSFYRYDRMQYIPEAWLQDIILNVRDRLMNLWDGLASIGAGVQSLIDQAIGALYNLLWPYINNAWLTINQVIEWVRTYAVRPVNNLVLAVGDLVTWAQWVVGQIRYITDNPVAWIWQYVSAYLYDKVVEWIQANWYAPR